MRKSCAQFVQSFGATCARTHSLCAHRDGQQDMGAGSGLVIPPILPTVRAGLYTVLATSFPSVIAPVFPTIHMANNNYNFLYISI
jgi:hypothetical protein